MTQEGGSDYFAGYDAGSEDRATELRAQTTIALRLARFANRQAWPVRRPLRERAWSRIAMFFYRLDHGADTHQ
jgi:hypothetical protein